MAWTDGRNYTARRHDVYVRRVSATGHPMGHDVGITGPGGTGFERLAAVVWNQATGKYLVVWEDERNLTVSGTSIFGRRVGTDGRSFGRHLNISGFTGMASARQPAVACNRTTGQCLVAWEDERNTATSGSDIYARRLNPDFGLEDFDTRVSGAGATGTEMSAAVAWSQSANRYLVVWSDGRNWASRDWDIYGRTLAG
ncbi:MAG: hypothetical protein MUE66_10560 [Acidimicrobiia bacterium]|nr:hypothetical protein [Acidimicrobiia bacterium]